MPDGNIEWMMFLYFALGALGGVAYLVGLIRDAIASVRLARMMSRRDS